jgi:hypothetical protein
LARRLVLGRTAASPTSFPLEEPASVSAMTILRLARQVRLRLVRGAQTHNSGVTPDAHEEANLHVTRKQQLAVIQATCPGKNLNAGLTSRATITSPSSPALPYARLNPRHSSTLYDAREPRLRLGRGKLGMHSGRLRQAQTTREKAKRPRGNSPTRPRSGFPDKASQLGFNASQRAATCDGTCQLSSTVTLFTSPSAPPLVTIKGREGQRSQGLDFHKTEHHLLGPGNELPLPTSL